jgi:hypothetical protein
LIDAGCPANRHNGIVDKPPLVGGGEKGTGKSDFTGVHFLPSPGTVPLDLFQDGELHLGQVFGSGSASVT